MEDIVGDYADKTVTLEDFPYFDHGVKMASVHPCKHASVMKVLLDRADAALKIRLGKMRRAGVSDGAGRVESGMEGLVDDMRTVRLGDKAGGSGAGTVSGVGTTGVPANAPGGDEWEVLDQGGVIEEEVAIRVDQYLVVFLKFMASVTPGIEHDFTMGV